MKNIKLTVFILLQLLFNTVYSQSEYIDSLKQRLNQQMPDTERVFVLNQLSFGLLNFDTKTGIEYGEKALELALKINDQFGIASSYLNMGASYSYQGNFIKASELFNKARKIYHEIGNESAEENCLNNLGINEGIQGNYTKALEYFIESQKIVEKLGVNIDIGTGYNNLGMVYQYLRNYDKAIECFNRSYEAGDTLGNPSLVAVSLNNLGMTYHAMGNEKKSIECYEKNLALLKGIDDKEGLATCNLNLGKSYIDIGDLSKAMNYLNNAKNLFEEIGDIRGIISTLLSIGNIFQENNEIQKAIETFDEAKKYAIESNIKDEVRNAYYKIAMLYSKTGDYKKAFEYHIIYTEYNDSLLNENMQQQFAEMQTKYETEKKDNEIKVKNLELEKNAKEIQSQRILTFSFLFGFFIILIFSILLYRQFVAKKKANVLLARQNIEINQKNEEITAQRDEIEAQRDEIARHRDLVVAQKDEIEASINYAKRIQRAVLPPEEHLNMFLSNYFILFRPKDIVSGDFYWATIIKNWQIVTVADCTGHGVPGAFMSMLGISFLNEIVRKQEVTKASDVLNHLRKSVIESLKQTGASSTSTAGSTKDGMDLSLCVINIENNSLQWAGANNPLYVIARNEITKQSISGITSPSVRNDEIDLFELKPDKMPIAIYERMDDFINHELQLNTGDLLYMMSDGYEDQFGGPKGKKFLSKNLKQLLVDNCNLPMSEQKEILETALNNWIGEGMQIDDITVLGIKI